jgi:DegV family protein with EDD domain
MINHIHGATGDKPMTRIALVTDSTSYLPPALLERYDIHVVPLYVLFGQQALRDNIDITPLEFYDRLTQVKDTLPTTSQPSAGDFRDVYQRLIADHDAIISLHISNHLSGTIASAQQARAMFPDFPIHIVDTLSTSMGLGYCVLAAARTLEAGGTAAAAVAAAEALIPHIRIHFAVDTLRYLHMGGRIGGASVLLGTALGIKPILELRSGKIEAAGKVRSTKRAQEWLVDNAVKQVGDGRCVRAAVLSAANPEGAERVMTMLRERLNCVELHIAEVSPVLGTHTGPGTVGVVYYAE